MAFLLANFQPAAGQSKAGAAPQIHTYRTEDAHATVDTADYFLPVRALLSIGDLIYVVVTASGALSTAGFHVVRTKTATSVDVTNVLAAVVTNTD
jgi:hypothetical protein